MLTFKRSSSVVAVCLLVACATSACRSRPAKPVAAPLPVDHQDVLTSFIKVTKCAPTTCDAVACMNISDGETEKMPSHLVRCRWNDTRTTTSGTPKRCAYVHYSVDVARNGFGNMFLSEPAFGDDCAPDAAFVELIKKTKGYSGAMP